MGKFRVGELERREFSKENPYSNDASFLTILFLSYIETEWRRGCASLRTGRGCRDGSSAPTPEWCHGIPPEGAVSGNL